MRIEKIKFKNINSLKGEHEINFDTDPLKNSGIFAIIGPTGSGKSTLLDVITLSLYNKVPRISKAISDTVIKETGTVLTRFADEAFASIEYSTMDGSFISTWSIRKNRNGKLVSPHMELIDKKDGKPMDLKKSEVPARNEELIGLSYDQFVKSIILSQGEFSKFLKADKNERGTLLEKITGTSIYRSIGRRVYERYGILKREIEIAEGKSEMIQLLSEEEIKETKNQIKEADEKQVVLEKQLVQLQNTKKTKELIQELQSQEKSNAASLLQCEAKGKELDSELKALAVHEQLSPFSASITLFKEAQTKSVKVKAEIDTLKVSIASDEAKFNKVIQQMGDLVKSSVTAENFIKQMKSFEAKISKMDNDLSTMKTQAKKIAAEVKQDAQNQSYVSAQAICTKDKGAEFQALIESHKHELANYLKEVDLDPNTKPESLINLLNETKKELEGLKEKQTKLLLRDTLQKEAKILNKQGLEIEKALKENKPSLVQLRKTLANDKESIDSLRKQKEKSQLRFSMKDARATLVEGEPCPLCGSTHHPDAHAEEAKPSGYDVEIAKYEKLIQANEKQIQSLEKSITTFETEQKNIQSTLKEKSTLLEEVEQWFKLNKVDLASLSDLESQVKSLETKANNYTKGGAGLQEYQWLLRCETKVNEIIQIGKDYVGLAKQRNELCSIKDAIGETNRLQGEYSGLASLLEKNKGLLSKSEKDNAQLGSELDKISADLIPALSKLGFNDISLVQNSLLPENKVAELKSRKAAFDKQKIELHTEKKSIDKELAKLSKQDDGKMTLAQLETILMERTEEKNNLLQQLGSWKNQLSKNETDKKTVGKLHKELEKMKVSLDNWALLNKMIGDKTGSKFANYAQNITLRHLLGLANRRLEHLFERYKLDMPQNGGELMVLDTYQGNIERGVSTLSGGETFMISLALALSLSDMASKNVALESLFIDEGFSTLDPEMLDLAMTTLDKIQSESQKTVGIISHVESLKERIDVQIQLEKNAQGFSTLKVTDGLYAI